MTIKPVIKWSGSKRTQAPFIASIAPEYDRYFEPFLGGGSVAYALRPTSGVCGDICEPLIDLWKAIKDDPESLAKSYEKDWSVLQQVGPDHFYVVRERFNEHRDAQSLLFLSRTCVNGLIRFNSKGDFNNSFHLSRPGINPRTLATIIDDWSSRISSLDFVHGDYRQTTEQAKAGDFVYLDPPYMNTVGRYYGTSTIDFGDFFSYLADLTDRGVKWALSFDGSRGDKQYTHALPNHLYLEHHQVHSGQSAFKRVLDKKLENVVEALFTNYRTPVPSKLEELELNTLY